jgi:hypothetical protein
MEGGRPAEVTTACGLPVSARGSQPRRDLDPPGLLQELRQQWNVALSVQPLTREAADVTLNAARHRLSAILLAGSGGKARPLI